MDDRVLGDMPSEGSESSRRFGIYSAYTDPKMHSISRIRLMFVLAIAIVVAFAVIFPMVQYALRSKNNLQSLPYPEIANISVSDESIARTNIHNCSTRVLAFGLDCTESPPIVVLSEDPTLHGEIVSYDVKTLEETSNGIQFEEDSTEIQMDIPVNTETKNDRVGRSRWPVVSTPYPYYSLPKPTPAAADDRNGFDLQEQTNIFAIPADMSTDNFSDYPRPRINFTPPPYAFTPFPNFTDSYAQLSPYKVPKNYTNFDDILKFLNSKEKINQPTENSERILTNRNNMMKVSGTYIMPMDRFRRPGEIVMSSSENNEEARPFFNGHAYVTDPFLKFRPANPSEINRLIPVKSGVDVGPRFRKPVSFVPSSAPVDLYARATSANGYSTAGSHTVAIFHPPPSLSNQRPVTTPPPQEKPLSVTLDIYPVTVEADQSDEVSMSPSTPGRVRGRLDPKWRPKTTERPRWRPQAPRRPPLLGGAKPSDNHMIVHLNLFPNKKKQYTFPRRGRQESTTQSHHKTTFLSGGQFSARSDKETSEEATSEEVENRGTTDSSSSTSSASSSAGSDEEPEYSALSGFGIEEIYTTTPGANHNNDTARGDNGMVNAKASGQNNATEGDARNVENKDDNHPEEGNTENSGEPNFRNNEEEKKSEENEDMEQENTGTVIPVVEYVSGTINRTYEKAA